MGDIATKLAATMHRSIRPGVIKLRDFVLGKPSARKLMAEVKSVDQLVADGLGSLHASYINAQIYLSVFGELASTLKEFSKFRAIVGEAEETYCPGWPPMSPVSRSYFSTWSMLDLDFSDQGDTLCSVAADLGRIVDMRADFIQTLDVMGKSAMGFYKHSGRRGDLISLRDILDGQVYQCIVPSGHQGRRGELWYVRLLPPVDQSCDHWVAITSPYVLVGTSESDWLAYFERQDRQPSLTPEQKLLERRALLKFGRNPNYWNEYIFLAYFGSTEAAISLRGIPDIPSSLPVGHLYNDAGPLGHNTRVTKSTRR